MALPVSRRRRSVTATTCQLRCHLRCFRRSQLLRCHTDAVLRVGCLSTFVRFPDYSLCPCLRPGSQPAVNQPSKSSPFNGTRKAGFLSLGWPGSAVPPSVRLRGSLRYPSPRIPARLGRSALWPRPCGPKGPWHAGGFYSLTSQRGLRHSSTIEQKQPQVSPQFFPPRPPFSLALQNKEAVQR